MKPKTIKTPTLGKKELEARALREARAATVTGKPVPREAKAILAEAESKAAKKAPKPTAPAAHEKVESDREARRRTRVRKGQDTIAEKQRIAGHATVELPPPEPDPIPVPPLPSEAEFSAELHAIEDGQVAAADTVAVMMAENDAHPELLKAGVGQLFDQLNASIDESVAAARESSAIYQQAKAIVGDAPWPQEDIGDGEMVDVDPAQIVAEWKRHQAALAASGDYPEREAENRRSEALIRTVPDKPFGGVTVIEHHDGDPVLGDIPPDRDALVAAGAQMGMTPAEVLEPLPDTTDAALAGIVASQGPVIDPDTDAPSSSVMKASELLTMLAAPASPAGIRKPVVPFSNPSVRKLVDKLEAARGDLAALQAVKVGQRTQTYRRMAGRYKDELIIEAGGVPMSEDDGETGE